MPGIVTGVRAVGSSKGYWIQDPSPDSNPATSEGIFVFTGSAPTVAPGDSVRVSGKVQEFYPLASGNTRITTSNLSITEAGARSISAAGPGSPGRPRRVREDALQHRRMNVDRNPRRQNGSGARSWLPPGGPHQQPRQHHGNRPGWPGDHRVPKYPHEAP